MSINFSCNHQSGHEDSEPAATGKKDKHVIGNLRNRLMGSFIRRATNTADDDKGQGRRQCFEWNEKKKHCVEEMYDLSCMNRNIVLKSMI